MPEYQVFSAIISLFFFVAVFLLIRRDKILMGAAIRWFGISIGVLVLGFYPELSDLGAKYLGISYPPILPIVLACLFLFIKVLLADIERAKTRVKLERLAQKLAILEAELKSKK